MEVDQEMILDKIHELRTLINGIVGYLSLIVDELVDDEAERSEFLQSAQQCVSYLLEHIHSLPSIETIFPGDSQLTVEKRQTFARLMNEFRVGAQFKRLIIWLFLS